MHEEHIVCRNRLLFQDVALTEKMNLLLIHINVHDFSNLENISAYFTNSICSLSVFRTIRYNKNPTVWYHVYRYKYFNAFI